MRGPWNASYSGGPEDELLQQDAFRVVILWVMEGTLALRMFDLGKLERCVTNLVVLTLPLMTTEQRERVVGEQQRLRRAIYAKPRPRPDRQSELLLELEGLFQELMIVMDNAGILYRAKVDPGGMGAE